tara:strand:+ start:412 stop:729 length:318 start_codon:yes stop_codon:yes gene_type:complete
MVKTKSKVKVLPVDSKVLEEVLKVVAQLVEPLPQPEEDDTFLLHRDDDELEPEPEPKPEPKPVRVKKLRPCERVKTPEDLERRRLHSEKRAIEDAEVIEYLESLK